MQEQQYTLKNITEKQLDIIYQALDMYTASGLLQFEECILKFYKYNNTFSYYNNFQEIDKKFQEIRWLIAKGNIKYEDYPEHAHWNLGAYNPDTPHDAKIAFDMYAVIKSKIHGKTLPKATELNNIILEKTNLRKEKIKILLNKNNNLNYKK